MLVSESFDKRLLFIITGGSVTSTLFKACFSCGEDPTIVQEGRSPCILCDISFQFCHIHMLKSIFGYEYSRIHLLGFLRSC